MSINCEYFKFINSRVICVNKMCVMMIIIIIIIIKDLKSNMMKDNKIFVMRFITFYIIQYFLC